MIHIDNETCKACDICGHVCPRHIIETIEREGEKVTLVFRLILAEIGARASPRRRIHIRCQAILTRQWKRCRQPL